MSDHRVSGISGVNSAVNPLAANPGSLLHLTNMISDVSGWAIKRHGIKQLNATSSYTSVFSGLNASTTFPVCAWHFDDHLFVYVEDGAGSGIAAYSMVQTGGWQKVVESAGILRVDSSQYKPKACTTDRRVLINTAAGIKRIAAIYNDNYPKDSSTAVAYSALYRDAGVPRALDPRCRNAVAGGGTDHGLFALTGFEWLLLSSAVAYRIAWFKRDENGIAGIGAPSGRVVVRNTSTTTNYATRLKIVIPSGVADSSYVMQIYRTNIIQMDGTGVIPDPGDDMFLAGEYRLTSTDLSNGYVLYEDVSFDPLLGADLYTNELQEGILAARTQPPVCRDISAFGGCTFFSNTTEKQRMLVKVLAVDSSGIGTFKGITVGDKIVMGDLVMEGIQGVVANEEAQDWYFYVDNTTGAGSEVIRALKTTESLCYKYNVWSNKKNGRYQAFNVTTNDDVFGVIQLEEKSVGGSTGAYVGVNRVDAPVQILPAPVFTSTPSNALAQACQVVTNAGPTLVTVTTAANHNLTTNDLVFLAPFANSTSSGTSSPKLTNTQVPSGVYKVTVTGATTFTFPSPSGAASAQTDARAAATGGYVHKIFDSTSSVWTEARSDNSRRVNRLMWSSTDEPEAVPIVNSADIGAADKAILRIVPTQDSLFIFKEDGTWRLKGDSGDWEIIVLDKSCVLAANETPGVVDGRVFCYSTNGVVSIDDGGVSKISTNVGGIIDNYYRSIATDIQTASSYSGTGHAEDQAYWITFGTQSTTWRYHCPTRTWSSHYWMSPTDQFALSFIMTAKCSRYTSFDNQAYAERLFIMYSGDTTIGVERKTGRVDELCDLDIPVTVNSFNSANNTVTLASVPAFAAVGDVFIWYANANYVPGGYGGQAAAKHRGIVAAINGNVLTLSNTDAMSSWPAVSGAQSGAILTQIQSRAVFTPISVGGGFNTGHFSEVDFSIGSRGMFSSMTAGFSTDVSFPTDITTTDSYTSTVNGYLAAPTTTMFKNRYPGVMPGLVAFRTGVPRQAAMASSIIIALNHNRAFEQFDVAGIRLITQDGDNRTRRTNA